LAARFVPSVFANPQGANGDIRVAIIGLGNKGKQHVDVFSALPGVRLVAVCDVDPVRIGAQVDKLKQKNLTVRTTTDFRRLLEADDIDAIVISAPNHWHAVMGVLACEAGKDVYVEKPVAHSIAEGEALIAAAQKHGRIMQAGTQYRSDEGLHAAATWLQEGQIGRPRWAHVLWYESRDSIGRASPHVPEGLDYDLYCGPAPLEPLTRTNLHYDWHWVWATGNGDLCNSGIHAYDICRWFAGETEMPRRVMSVGGRYSWDDAGQTPNSQLALLDSAVLPMMIEIRNLPQRAGLRAMDSLLGIREGFVLHYEGGYFAGLRGGGTVYDTAGKQIRRFPGDGGASHAANFIGAVRSRRVSDLNAPITTGHISTATCELGNISWRLGRPSDAAGCHAAVEAHQGAAETLARLEKNVVANGVDLNAQPFTLGPWLEIGSGRISSVIGAGPESLYKARQLERGSRRKPFDILVS
jgi:predicted dehydrogenase